MYYAQNNYIQPQQYSSQQQYEDIPIYQELPSYQAIQYKPVAVPIPVTQEKIDPIKCKNCNKKNYCNKYMMYLLENSCENNIVREQVALLNSKFDVLFNVAQGLNQEQQVQSQQVEIDKPSPQNSMGIQKSNKEHIEVDIINPKIKHEDLNITTSNNLAIRDEVSPEIIVDENGTRFQKTTNIFGVEKYKKIKENKK